MKYGEKIIAKFNPDKDLEIWENVAKNDYVVYVTLPEFVCFCPRSGYPDLATIFIAYVPDKFVVELKAIKLYINSFLNRKISHENAVNEIYNTLYSKLKPKYLRVTGDFNPRGNVHTVIEVDSNITKQSNYDTKFVKPAQIRNFER